MVFFPFGRGWLPVSLIVLPRHFSLTIGLQNEFATVVEPGTSLSTPLHWGCHEPHHTVSGCQRTALEDPVTTCGLGTPSHLALSNESE